MTAITKGQAAAADVAALLRARNPLLWIVTREESRAEALLFEAAASANYVAHTWDVAQGRGIGGRGSARKGAVTSQGPRRRGPARRHRLRGLD